MIVIVGSNLELSGLWARHLERQNEEAVVFASQDEAVAYLQEHDADVIVLDLMLEAGSAIAVADFASYRHPATRIVFVTPQSFFSDGSLFTHIPNAAAVLPDQTSPQDLAEIVAYHGRTC